MTAGAGMCRPSWVSASTPWIRPSAFHGAFLARLRMLNPVMVRFWVLNVRNRRWRGIWFARRGAVGHDPAADRQSAKNRGQDAAADGFEHNVESGHSGSLQRPGHEALAMGHRGVDGRERGGLGRGTHPADDAGGTVPGQQLADRGPDAAAGRCHQHRIAGAGVRDTHEPESGSPGERDGRRGGEVKACGNRHGQTRAGDRDVRQPGPVDRKRHHPVPGRESIHPLAQGMDGAADLHPRHERPPGEVAGHAAPGQDVDEVQSRVLDPDGYLARPGAGSSRSANRTTSGPPGSMISIALTGFSNPVTTGAEAQRRKACLPQSGGRDARVHHGRSAAARSSREPCCGRQVVSAMPQS